VKNKVNNPKLSINREKNFVEIDFDFIDKKEGFIIYIYHTGEKLSEFYFEGTLKGHGKIKETNKLSILSTRNSYFSNYLAKLLGRRILRFIVIFVYAYLTISCLINSITDNLYYIIGFIIFGMMVLFLYKRKLLPKGFEIFNE
jgi:hypothetical protein